MQASNAPKTSIPDYRIPDQAEHNPFVAITPGWTVALVTYIFFWQVVAPLLSIVLHGTDDPYTVQRSLVRVITGGLAILPLVVPRLGGVQVGWLHPLVMPLLVADAMEIIKAPLLLIAPLLVWIEPLSQFSANEMLVGWGRETVYKVMLKTEALTLLSQLSLYAGYLLFKWRPLKLTAAVPRRISTRLTVIFTVMFIAFAIFLQIRGGLNAHIASFGMGRHKQLGELGYIIGVFRATPILLVVWYSLDRGAVRRPLFYAMTMLVCLMQFVATGTRSGVIFPLIALALVHLWHTRKIPVMAIVVVGLITPLVIGVLGQIRFSTWQGAGTVDYSAVTNFDIQKTLETTATNVEYRFYTNPQLPTIAKVPDQIGLLWGKSYIGALFFFVPRALWETKPRGIGAYAVSDVMEAGRGMEGFYQGAGASPGSVAEAYWNFHIAGVVGVYLLFGGFLRWVSLSFMVNGHNPAAVPLFITTILNFSQPGSSSFSPYVQLIVVILAAYWVLGLWGRRMTPHQPV